MNRPSVRPFLAPIARVAVLAGRASLVAAAFAVLVPALLALVPLVGVYLGLCRLSGRIAAPQSEPTANARLRRACALARSAALLDRFAFGLNRRAAECDEESARILGELADEGEITPAPLDERNRSDFERMWPEFATRNDPDREPDHEVAEPQCGPVS